MNTHKHTAREHRVPATISRGICLSQRLSRPDGRTGFTNFTHVHADTHTGWHCDSDYATTLSAHQHTDIYMRARQLGRRQRLDVAVSVLWPLTMCVRDAPKDARQHGAPVPGGRDGVTRPAGELKHKQTDMLIVNKLYVQTSSLLLD